MRINAKKKECANAPIGPFTTFSHCVYDYNIRNELVSATKNAKGAEVLEYQYQYSTNSLTPNSSTPSLISMSYDRMGRRVTKNNQRFIYDGYLQIADNNGNAYVWDPMDKVSTRPLTWLYGSSVAYYTHDGNKNVSEVVLAESTVVAHYEYAPFGETTVARGESANQNPWRFSSEYGDDLLGLEHYNFRCYAPMLGCWMSRDPVVEDGSFRLFLGNDPLLMCDVLGLSPLPNVKVAKWDTAQYDAHEKEMDANSAKYNESARNSKEPDCSKYGLLWQKICGREIEGRPVRFYMWDEEWRVSFKVEKNYSLSYSIDGSSGRVDFSKSACYLVKGTLHVYQVIVPRYKYCECVCQSFGPYMNQPRGRVKVDLPPYEGLEGVWDESTKIKASGKEWRLSGFEVGIGPMSGSWSVPTSTLE